MHEVSSTVTTLISQFGYPIVVSLIAFWYIYKSNEQYRNDMKETRETHDKEVRALSEAVNNNTLVMQKLVDRLGGGNIEIKS